MYEKKSIPLKSTAIKRQIVENGDVVRIKDSDIDWLRDNFNQHYDGNPIKCFSPKFAIKLVNDYPGSNFNEWVLFYVRSLDENDSLIQVDMYQHTDDIIWTEVLINNEKLMPSEDGRFIVHSISFGVEGTPDSIVQQVSAYMMDVVRYVLFFIGENINNPEYVSKNVTTQPQPTKPKKSKKHTTSKPRRRTVYIPKKVTVPVLNTSEAVTDMENTDYASTVASTSINMATDTSADMAGDVQEKSSDSTSKRPYSGHMAFWETRGYYRTITRKDGTTEQIWVRPSTHRRNPKLLNGNGVDYKLTPPDEFNG